MLARRGGSRPTEHRLSGTDLARRVARRPHASALPTQPPPPPPSPLPPHAAPRVLALDVEFDHYRLPPPAAGAAAAPPPPKKGRAARKAAARRNPPPPPPLPTARVPASLALVDASGAPLLWAAILPPSVLSDTAGAVRVSRRGDRPTPPDPPFPSPAAAGAAVAALLAGPTPVARLVGHGLAGDLRALGLEPAGLACALTDTLHLLPGTRLAAAAATHLPARPPIQARGRGCHCPAEDAGAAMGLWLALAAGGVEAETVSLLAEVGRRRED